MAELRVCRALVTLVVLLFTAQIHSQKILSDRKKCGDPQCESLMMRVSAKQDYSGPDCRFLTFKTGDEINVYYKLTGRRDDLWQGSKGKAYGFFPKNTVTIEEVYLRDEIEIPAQEIDFVCLDGGEYFFENEDSVLHNIDVNEEDPMDYIQQEGGKTTEETPDVITQETPEAEDPDKESWAPSGIAGWFGIGKTNEKKEPKPKNMETINEEAEPQKQPEETPAEKSSWLGGRIKKFLPFGEQKDEPQAKDNDAHDEKPSNPTQQTEQEQRNINKDDEDSKSKWFNFGIRDVLGFGAKNKKIEELKQNVEETDKMTPENQNKTMDSNTVPDQSDISRMDHVGKTKGAELNSDTQEADTTVTNAPEKGGSDESTTQSIDMGLSPPDQKTISRKADKETIKSTKSYENQDPSPSQGTTHWFKSIVSNVLNLGKSHGKEKETIDFGGDEHSIQTQSQVDKSRQQVASNGQNKYPDTLSHGREINVLDFVVDDHAKDDLNNLTEIHQSKVHLGDTLTEVDGTFQDDEKEHDEKPRSEEAEPSTQMSGSGQEDDSREHVAKKADANDFSDTLSQGIELNNLIHEVSSVLDEHAKDEGQNLKETQQPKVHPEDTLTEKNNTFQDKGGEYEEKTRHEEADCSTQMSGSGQEDDSREDVAKNIDVKEFSDTLSQGIGENGLIHEVSSDEHAKDKGQNQPNVLLQDALAEKDTTFQDEGGKYDEKPSHEEAEHFTQMSGSGQVDDSREHVADNIEVNDFSDTLSQGIDVNTHIYEVGSFVDDHAKDEGQNLKDAHQPKVHLDDALTKKDNTFQDEGGEFDENPRPEDAPRSTQISESSQPDDSREHKVMIDRYSDTLSHNVQVLNHEDIERAKISPVDKWIMEGGSGYKETSKRLQETINPMENQEWDHDQNLDAYTSLTSHHLIDEPESTIEENVSPNPRTVEDEVEETSENLKIEVKASIEREDKPVCTTSVNHDCWTAESRQDGLHDLTAGSIYTAEDKTAITTMEIGGPDMKVETDAQWETLGSADEGNGPTGPQLRRSQEDREDMEGGIDTPESSEEDISSQCAAEEAAGTSGHCPSTKSPDQPWKRPHGAEEKLEANVPIQSNPWVLAFTVMLRKIFAGYSEVCSRYLVPVRSRVTSTISKVVSLLPDDLQPGADFYGCSWDVVIFTALFGFLSVLVFTCRTVRCIKSRFYAGREYKLGNQVAEVLSSKREVLEKLSIVQKQYEDVQQSLQESGHQKLLTEISEQKALQESLQASNKELEENIGRLERDLEEERQRGSELDNTLAELNEKIKALEETFKKETSQKEEIRTTQKVFEINKGRLESSLQDAAEEKSLLEESIKQLSKEAEGWEERSSELSENSRILSSSVGVMQEDLSSKQNQIKSLIDNLLALKDWSSELDEANNDVDNDVLSSIKWDFENGEPLGDPQKQRIKKLIYAAMLNASLKSVESEKKHLCDNLSDEMKAKEQLAECITNLQNTSQSLAHDKGQLEEEVEKLKQKMSVMMEVYQENERKLHRKLTVQEKERIQKEAKLSKADEKVNMAASELVTVKTRVSELEEEMERTISSYQNQVTSYEKKSHDNWLTARAAERYLSDVKKETAHLRQKLTESEYKLELLEKDPFALDVIQAIGRDNSPFGMSPSNRHPESRAFLSPPTLLEGPLRLSPMLPGADRGVRPPGYYPGYPGPKERGDVNSDRRADHQRTLSDAGSLSPPWDREQRNNVPPPGLPYPEPPFPPRRAERFYHYPPPSGRFSGPAELTRNQGKPFMESQDGRTSPEYKARINTSRNGEEDANNISAASSQDNEAMDGPPGDFPMHHPPPMRVPLLPRDPRAPYFRRPLMPHPPVEMYGPPGYPGMPPPLIPMRSPVPPPQQHHYPAYPMHGEAYFPPQPIRPPTRNDPSLDSAHPPQDKLPEPTT